METIKPLIGISWSNVIIFLCIIVVACYTCIKIMKKILK